MTDHESIYAGFVEDARARAGAQLVSVVAYGSSLGPHFRPGVSDYNFLIVADPVDLALLERLSGLTGKWRKKRISPPIVLEPGFVSHALDSWPLEFLTMSARYRVLEGTDPFSGINFQREHVRLQCEREIRSKLLLVRRSYLECEGAPKRMKAVLDRGWPSLQAILQGLLYLKDGPWQAQGPEAWEAGAKLLAIPSDLFTELHALRLSRSVPARESMVKLFERVLETLRRLSEEVDRW